MPRSRVHVLFALTLAMTAACSLGPRSLEEAEKTPEAAETRDLLDSLAHGSTAAIEPRLDASLNNAETLAQLQLAATYFPKEAATRVHLVGFNSFVMNALGGETTKTTAVTYELNYLGANVVASATFRQIGEGKRSIVGINVHPFSAPLDVLNAVTFAGKGPVHYLFVGLMIAVASVTVAALVVWARRRKVIHRRWWWLLGILLGAFKISLNWTTGEVHIQAVTVQLFSMGFAKPGPLILLLSLPVGAVAFLILQRRAVRAVSAPLSPPVS